MQTIKPGNSACFFIDGEPYQRGDVTPLFDGDKVRLQWRNDVFRPIINWTLYSDIENGNTNNPFASKAELITFLTNYVFQTAGNGGGGGGGTVPNLIKSYIIKAVPAGGNEKPEGQYINDAAFLNIPGYDVVISLVSRNGNPYHGVQIDHDGTTGDVGLTGGDANTFQDGDEVVILGIVTIS